MREMEQSRPSIRIHLFGEFIVERLLSSPASPTHTPRYERVRHEEWHSRGPAIALLKVLLCCPRRRASRDTLIEFLWPSAEDYESEHAFDSAVSILRKVLREQQGESLLTKVRIGGVTIYALPNQQHLWIDADAFEQYIDQAMKAERRGEDSLSLWEAAHALVVGEFLEDDLYSGWAQARRHILNAARHCCVHRLVDLYSARNMGDQAETLLQEVVLDDPSDEDALCRLMLLLEQRGRYQEALHLYHHNVRVLDEEYHNLAENITAQRTLGEDRYATGFNRSRLAGYKGACFVRLHRSEEALAALNEAVAFLDPLAIRRKSTLLTDMASAHVQQGEIEEACRLAGQALSITTQTRSISVLQRIRSLRRDMELWKTIPSVKDVDEQIIATFAIITS